jgi:hypothetical protein
MIAGLAPEFGKDDIIDNQIATALLTGIVAETERFGNAKTTPHTMEVSAQLLTAGANQELVATKLAEPEPMATLDDSSSDDGLIDGLGDNDSDQGPPGDGGSGDGNDSGDPGMLEITHEAPEAGHDGGGSENLQSAADALDVSQPVPDDQPQDEQQEQHEELPEQPQQQFSQDQPQEQFSEPGTVDKDGEITPLINSLEPPTPAAESTPMPEVHAEEEQAKAEEAAALQLIKDHKVEMKDHAVLQPLEGQNGQPDSVPSIIHNNQKPLDTPTPDSVGLPDNKFALTPPSMGSALNSTEGGGDSLMDSPTASLSENRPADGPLLTHSAPHASTAEPSIIPEPKLAPAPPAHELAAKPQAEEHLLDMPAPAASSAPASGPVPSPALIPQYKPEPAGNSPLIAPVFDMAAKPADPAPTGPAAVTTGLSLADLEKKVGSAHTGPTASTESVDSGAKPMDMPKPSSPPPVAPPPIPAPTAAPSAAAPPPVPPPMMPPMPRAN